MDYKHMHTCKNKMIVSFFLVFTLMPRYAECVVSLDIQVICKMAFS